MDAENKFDGLSRLLTVSFSREAHKSIIDREEKGPMENGDLPLVENGVTPVEQKITDANADERDRKSPTKEADERRSDD